MSASPALAAVLRALHDRGLALDARAVRLVRTHYRLLDLEPLIEVLNIRATVDSLPRRMGYTEELLAEFDRLAAVLGPAPEGTRELLGDAVRLGMSGVHELLDAQGADVFDLSAEREARLIEASQARFDAYWPNESPRFRTGVSRVLAEGMRMGRSPAEITTALDQQVVASRRRAALIVRNETGTAQGFAAEQEQRALGVGRYRWSTARDQRVRPEHRAREGKTYDWDHPPDDGPPGVPILCRCVAVPLPPDTPRK